MTLTISFQSTRGIDAAQLAELNEYAKPILQRYRWQHCRLTSISTLPDGHGCGELVLEIQKQPVTSASGSGDSETSDSADFVTALSVLCELSHAFEIDWVFQHEFEPKLGEVCQGVLSDGLIHEIEVSLRVATSLAGLLSGDEFVEEFEPGDDALDLRDVEPCDSWEPMPSERFPKFPELPDD